MVRSDLCYYIDEYIVLKGDVTLIKTEDRGFIDVINRFLAFKNNAPLSDRISKVNGVLIHNAENLDVVMPMYILLEYSQNHRNTTGSWQNYYRNGSNDFPAKNYNADPIKSSYCFKYETSITVITSNADQQNGENTEQENTKTKKNLEIIVPLKHLSNFWRTLDIVLINCEINLILTQPENGVLTDVITQTAKNSNSTANPTLQPTERIDTSTNATFQITDRKLYVPVVTLSTEDDNR